MPGVEKIGATRTGGGKRSGIKTIKAGGCNLPGSQEAMKAENEEPLLVAQDEEQRLRDS